jgi:UDP-N-acetylmuramate dehydrogenase
LLETSQAFKTHHPLENLNTFNVNVYSKSFLVLNNHQELSKWFEVIDSFKKRLVLGGGSNMLFIGDYSGLILYPQFFGMRCKEETSDFVILNVAASVNWHQWVIYALKQGYYGIENLACIPGTVGGAPIQNIGAYGVEVEKSIISVECFDLKNNCYVVFSHDSCQFSYRNSLFKQAGHGRYLVCSVNFKLQKKPQAIVHYAPLKQAESINKSPFTPQDVFKWVCQTRQKKLPNPDDFPNAGSFFKNPIIDEVHYLALKTRYPSIPSYLMLNQQYKIPAAWLIEQSGFKGFFENGVGVHPKHSLILVNYTHQSGKSIFNLAKQIIKKIENEYSIQLIPEVCIIQSDNKKHFSH